MHKRLLFLLSAITLIVAACSSASTAPPSDAPEPVTYDALMAEITTLGKPTVVIALLDLGGRGSPHMVFPALHKVFVGAALRLSDVGADVFYKALVPPEHIERILQPGEPDYESLGDLPR